MTAVITENANAIYYRTDKPLSLPEAIEQVRRNKTGEGKNIFQRALLMTGRIPYSDVYYEAVVIRRMQEFIHNSLTFSTENRAACQDIINGVTMYLEVEEGVDKFALDPFNIAGQLLLLRDIVNGRPMQPYINYLSALREFPAFL